jgi:hypothetical protein
MENKQNWMVQRAMKSEAFRSLLVEPDMKQDKYQVTLVPPQEKIDNDSEEPSQEDIEQLVEWAKNRRQI